MEVIEMIDIIEKLSVADCNIIIDALEMKRQYTHNQKAKLRATQLKTIFLLSIKSKNLKNFENKFLEEDNAHPETD